MDSRPARVARGFAAAGVSTLVAACSHAMGGGIFPHPLLLLVGLMFSGLFCVALTGRRVSLVRVVPSVAGSQILFHFLFSMTGTDATVVAGDAHAHHAALTFVPSTSHYMGSGGGMVAAHVIAALITIVALRFGESAFWGLFDTARLMLAAAFRFAPAVALPVAVPPVRAADAGFVPVLVPEFLACVQHRGPPASAVSV